MVCELIIVQTVHTLTSTSVNTTISYPGAFSISGDSITNIISPTAMKLTGPCNLTYWSLDICWLEGSRIGETLVYNYVFIIKIRPITIVGPIIKARQFSLQCLHIWDKIIDKLLYMYYQSMH